MKIDIPPAGSRSHVQPVPNSNENSGAAPVPETSVFERVYAIIRQVPPGQVVTYGQVSRLVGGISAQMVGFALAGLRGRSDVEPVPWQRVINAQGKISPHGMGFGTAVQRDLLEEEGVVFDAEDRVDLAVYRWNLTA